MSPGTGPLNRVEVSRSGKKAVNQPDTGSTRRQIHAVLGTGWPPAQGDRKRKWGRPCGRPHSHRRVVSAEAKNLAPGAFRTLAVRQRCYVARRSRRCRFRRGTDEVRRLRPNHPAVPRPVDRPCSSSPAMRGTAEISKPAGKPGLPTARLRGFNGLEVAIARKRSSALIPPPRGISPSRRRQFQNLFIFQGFTPSIRRANPCSRWVEDARRIRVGQWETGRLIHFRQDCQWTTVDNSTSRRDYRHLSTITFSQKA